jgi:hypothetical protein
MNRSTLRSHGNNFDSFENSETEHPTWTSSASKSAHFISKKLLDWGVETRGAYDLLTLNPGRPLFKRCSAEYRNLTLTICHLIGIHPVGVEDRTETHFVKIFFVWLSANMNILPCVFSFNGSRQPGPMILPPFIVLRRDRWVR